MKQEILLVNARGAASAQLHVSQSALSKLEARELGDSFRVAILASLLLHALLLVQLGSLNPPREARQQALRVSIIPPAALVAPKSLPTQRQQFVPDSERSLELPRNFQASKLAAKDSFVQQEQLKRGVDPEAGKVVAPKPAPPRKQVPQPPVAKASATKKTTSKKQAPSRKPARNSKSDLNLKLSPEDILTGLATRRPQANTPSPREAIEAAKNAPLKTPEDAGPAGGARFFGARGTSSFLPNLPDGDITLLNTKANQFAVFVRRVALEVFRRLRDEGWAQLPSSEIRAASAPVLIEAVMSLEGEFESLRLIESSGSRAFDQLLERSSRAGTRDPNPPASAAAADGKIRFLFKAKSWLLTPRGRARGERRWLLLSTGLL